jgi:hypothetical protein
LSSAVLIDRHGGTHSIDPLYFGSEALQLTLGLIQL